MRQEGQDTKQQINLWESEIRKLWAIANERNRDWIKENQSRLKTVSATLNGIRASNRDLKAATGRHEAALKVQQQVIDQVTSLELQLQRALPLSPNCRSSEALAAAPSEGLAAQWASHPRGRHDR